ncbi:condensation domain-containing protein [Spongiactinospora sp. 9N601]|uniref:condensation domain-containing protein n=1 Tax=Spongiactinospora sp. 9N601 TaxID=3375149 RepID=UPI00378B2A17
MGRDELAAELLPIWRSVLGDAAEIQEDTDFFRLGGHSMHGARLMARVSKRFGVELPIQLIFEEPVFGRFVTLVHDALGRPAEAPVPVGHTSAPLSAQQRELLRLEELLGPSPVSNMVLVAELGVPVRTPSLRSALSALPVRHPVLRAAFDMDAGRQVLRPATEVPLEELDIDVPPMEPSRQASAVRRAVRRAYLRPFDPAAGGMLRAQLIRVPGRGPLLALHLHHLVADGVSQEVLLEDLAAEYAALTGPPIPGTPAAAPAPPSAGYLDYAVWQHERRSAVLASSAAHWREVVRALVTDPTRTLLTRPAPATRFTRGSAVVPADTVAAVRRWASHDGGTDFMVVAAAVAGALHAMSGQTWTGLGTLLDNRSRTEFDRTVGPMANSGLLAVQAGPDATPGQLLARVRAELLRAWQWSELPLELMLERPAQDAGLSPGELVDMVVTVERPFRSEGGALPMTVVPDEGEPMMPAVPATRRDLTATVQAGGELALTLEYADDAAEKDHAAAFLAALTHVFGRFADHPGEPVGREFTLVEGRP